MAGDDWRKRPTIKQVFATTPLTEQQLTAALDDLVRRWPPGFSLVYIGDALYLKRGNPNDVDDPSTMETVMFINVPAGAGN